MTQREIEAKLNALSDRNARVATDKAWETSWTRRLGIMLLTYLVVVCYLHFVVRIEPFINGLVPVIGFFLSTVTLSFVKNMWLKLNNRQ